MSIPPQHTRNSLRELRLFLEEICCNLCRFQHLYQNGYAPESVKINQEVYLGMPDAFADIKVTPPWRADLLYRGQIRLSIAAPAQ